jgi:hypothetical protein
MEKKPDEKPSLTVKEMAAMGGKARAKGLTKKRRKEIAASGARARWGDKAGEGKKS